MSTLEQSGVWVMWRDEVKPLVDALERRELRRNRRDEGSRINEIAERFEATILQSVARNNDD